MSDRVSTLLHTRRWCYWIPTNGYVKDHGYRVSVVFENDSGHYPTGDDAWIAGDASKRKPWFWGHDYDEARKVAEEMNQEKLGLSPRDAETIVTSSMAAKRTLKESAR